MIFYIHPKINLQLEVTKFDFFYFLPFFNKRFFFRSVKSFKSNNVQYDYFLICWLCFSFELYKIKKIKS